MEATEETNFLLRKNSVILIDFTNTITAFSEAVLQKYYSQYNPKRKKTFDELTHVSTILELNFSTKEYENIKSVYLQDHFHKLVSPIEGAIQALNEMRGCGYDVQIIATPLSNNFFADIIEWCAAQFQTNAWASRIIFTHDKTRIKGDFLIDDDPFPEKGGNLPEWKHFIFDRPWNRTISEKGRISQWKNWKIDMGLEDPKIKNLISYRHGSPDSKDADIYYVFPSMPSAKECFVFFSGAAEDRNVITLENGFVKEVLKGHHDEHHKQLHPLLVLRKKTRIIPVKVITCIRTLIGRLSDVPKYRQQARQAIKETDLNKAFQFFNAVDFTDAEGINIEQVKAIAFQLAITLGLMEGVEYYTKGEVANAFPDLKPFMYREENSLNNLSCMNSYRDLVTKKLSGVRWLSKSTFMMFTCKKEDISEWNFYNTQSRGLVVDMRAPGGCIYFGIMHNLMKEASFPIDLKIPSRFPNQQGLFVGVFMYNGTLQYCTEEGFEGPEIDFISSQEQIYQFSQLQFAKYYHTLAIITTPHEGKKLYLIGLRSILSLDLITSIDVISDEAARAGLLFMESKF